MGEHCVWSRSSYDLKCESVGIFLSISIWFILCHPNVLNKIYHDTVEDKVSAEHIGGLMGIILYQIMEKIHPKTRNPFEIFVLSIISIWCLLTVSNKLYHRTWGYQLYAQHKIRIGDGCLGEHCVWSWRSYGLIVWISLIFFVYLRFVNIMSS